MYLPVPRRALVGLVAVCLVVTAGLLVSPSATATAFATVANDPVTFGGLVAALYLVRPLLAWPTTPLAVVVGYGFGVTAGIPIAMAGIVVTVIPPFLAARWVANGTESSAVRTLPMGTHLSRIGRSVERYYETTGPTRGVVVSRLVPIPSDVATCAAAASGVSLPRFLAGTAIGELPWTVGAVVVGASAATLTAEGIDGVGPLVVGVSLLAAALLCAGPLYRAISSERPDGIAG